LYGQNFWFKFGYGITELEDQVLHIKIVTIDSMAEKKKLSDFPKNTENPFLKKMILDLEPTTKRKFVSPSNREMVQTVYNNETGEITGHTAFMQYVEVDEKQFTKLYLSNMAAFWDLSKPAIRVFTYVMAAIRPNQDKFYFILEDCMDHTEYRSKTMIFEGLADLLEKQIIARGRTQFEYFINPMVAFNGNRITFAKTYIKRKLKDENPDQLNLFGDIEKRNFKALKGIADKAKIFSEDESN
jgi:hypothetical protein